MERFLVIWFLDIKNRVLQENVINAETFADAVTQIIDLGVSDEKIFQITRIDLE